MKFRPLLTFLLMLGWSCCYGSFRSKPDSLRIELLKANANKKQDSDTSKINDLNRLSAAYESSYPDSSIYFSEMAIRLSRAAGYNKGIADGLLAAARIYFTQGKNALTIQYLNQATSLYAETNNLAEISNCDKVFGDLYCQNSDYKKALFYYKRSLAVKLSLKDQQDIAHIYLDLGNVYNGLSAYSTALDYYFKSLNIDSKLHNPNAIAGDYIDIGSLLQNMDINPKALDYYNRALLIYNKLHSSNGIAITKQNIGEVFLSEGKYDEAIRCITEALAIYLKRDNKDGISQLYGDLGICYLYKEQQAKALDYLQKSLDVAVANQLDGDRTTALTNLALYYNKGENYQKAYQYAVQAKSWADHINSVFLQKSTDIQWIRALGGLHKYKEAFMAQRELDKINFNAHKDESVQKFTLYNTEYNFATKEQQHLLQQKASALLYQQKIRDQRLLTIIFVIISVASVFIIGLYYKQKRTQMKINNQLNEKNREVVQHQTDLDESNKLKDRLIAILAHDLRSPLSTLRGLFKLFEDDSLSLDELLEMIPGVVSKLDYTSDFLDTLLFWINSQMENYRNSTKCFSVNEVIEAEYENYKEQAAMKGIDIRSDIAEPLAAFADPNSVRIVVRNLVTNAIKFSNTGDHITIAAVRRDNNILVSVSDTGAGMTAEQKNKLFKYRVDSTIGTHNESGTGMGLLFCKDLVEKGNGEIWVESQQNKGTVFYFSIPNEECAA